MDLGTFWVRSQFRERMGNGDTVPVTCSCLTCQISCGSRPPCRAAERVAYVENTKPLLYRALERQHTAPPPVRSPSLVLRDVAVAWIKNPGALSEVSHRFSWRLVGKKGKVRCRKAIVVVLCCTCRFTLCRLVVQHSAALGACMYLEC